jgi:hypothetical protein
MNCIVGKKTEQDIFILIIVFNLLRFATPSVFPTLDGPSHLANASIIKNLILEPHGFLANIYTLNPVAVPNWTTHAILALLLVFLPAWLAEKVLLFILVAGFPLAFRKLVNTINPTKSYLSFLVFPFTLSSFLFFGFFNFCISVIFFLITLDFWLNNYHKPLRVKFILGLSALVTLIYFSHILSYGLLLIFISMHILSTSGLHVKNIHKIDNHKIKTFIKRMLIVVVISSPTLFLGFSFFFTGEDTIFQWKSIKELASELLIIKPLIKFNADLEQRYTILLSAFLFGLLMVGMSLFFKRKEKINTWIPLTLAIMLFLYFFMPESIGSASFTNQRVALFIGITLILFLATLPFPGSTILVTIPVSFFLHYTIFHAVKNNFTDMEPFSKQCYEISAHIRPNTVIFPVDLMDNWFTGHFSDFAVAGVNAAMVYNYESEAGYFPVLAHRNFPRFYIGDPSNSQESVIFNDRLRSALFPVDYILLMEQYPGKGSSAAVTPWFMEKLRIILDKHYMQAYRSGHLTLYERKSRRSELPVTHPSSGLNRILHPLL